MIDRRNLFMELMSSIGLNPKIENYINGKLVPGIGQTITLIDPYTTDELTNYKDATAILAQEACNAASGAQSIWFNDYNASSRGQLMQQVSFEINKNIENIAKLEAIISGKPVKDCRVEISKVAEMFSYYSGCLLYTSPSPRDATLSRMPSSA